MLNDWQYEMQGFNLPNETQNIEQLFVDDTNLYVHGTLENLDRVMGVINLFFEASRLRINQSKMHIIWTSDENQDWNCREEFRV
jgi:hypothetical protein